MKFKIKLIAVLLTVILIFTFGLGSVTASIIFAVDEEAYQEQTSVNLYDDAVEVYRETVTAYCTLYSIPEYIETVMKMLSIYSQAHTTDILNSSYSYLNNKYEHKYEGITKIDYSLRIGIIQLSEWEKYITYTYSVRPFDNNNYLVVLLEAYELQDKEYIDYALSGVGYSPSDVLDYCSSSNFKSEKNKDGIDCYFASQIINMLTITSVNANDIQRKIVELAIDYSNYAKNGIRTKGGYCLRFANDTLQSAGLNIKRADCARCSGAYFGVSNDFSNIPIGAEIYCYASQQYGHVGIYIGNGYVVHCTTYKNSDATVLLTVDKGYVLKQPLLSFILSYKAACWGFSGAWSEEYPYHPEKYMTTSH